MMIVPAVLLGETHWLHRVVVVGAFIAPLPTLVFLAAAVAKRTRRGDSAIVGEEAAALLEVLASLQSGQTLRTALAGMSPEIDRLVTVGASSEALADAVARALDEQGAVAGAAVRLLDRAGGPAAPVIEELAAQATETMRIRRELRAAVAAPVLQGVIVGGAPMAVLIFMIASGGFGKTFAASPAHAITVSVGAVMTVVGVGWVLAIVKRALP